MPDQRPSTVLDGPVVATPERGETRDGPLADARAMQILSAEYAGLVAARSLAYNEAFTRAGMFLAFLSSTLIVIGFLLGSDAFRPNAVPVTALLLLSDLLVGLATLGRLIDASREELRAVRGMNRLRHAFLEMVPGLGPYFITSAFDDGHGVLATYGGTVEERSLLANVGHGMTTTTGMVATVDSLILGALAALAVLAAGFPVAVGIGSGLAGFVVGFLGFAVLGMRRVALAQSSMEARFPTPGA